MKQFIIAVLSLFRPRYIIVWHQDSPGTKVVVKRTPFQDIFSSYHFSNVGEKHLQCFDLAVDDRTREN